MLTHKLSVLGLLLIPLVVKNRYPDRWQLLSSPRLLAC